MKTNTMRITIVSLIFGLGLSIVLMISMMMAIYRLEDRNKRAIINHAIEIDVWTDKVGDSNYKWGFWNGSLYTWILFEQGRFKPEYIMLPDIIQRTQRRGERLSKEAIKSIIEKLSEQADTATGNDLATITDPNGWKTLHETQMP